MDEAGYYRCHSRLTDPGGRFVGLPTDVAGMAEVIGGVVVHRDDTARSVSIGELRTNSRRASPSPSAVAAQPPTDT